jgi:hypothetical protein
MSFIFISYSRQDQTYVGLLVKALESHGLPVWMDQRIDYGSRWTREIEEHLERCQVFLLVMSPRSKESDWVDRELTWAQQLKKKIFPLLLEGKEWFQVGNIQATDVTGKKLPPAEFFEAISACFPRVTGKAESLPKQTLPKKEILTPPVPKESILSIPSASAHHQGTEYIQGIFGKFGLRKSTWKLQIFMALAATIFISAYSIFLARQIFIFFKEPGVQDQNSLTNH